MNQSPLHEMHAASGARFGAYYGWEIAQDFGRPEIEYQAVRNHAAILDLSYLGKLRVSGRDRTRFLNSLLSNDIKNLKTETGCYATLLTHQGRMESDLFVHALQDEFLLECSPAGREQLFQSLNRYLVSDVVTVEDVSLNFCILSLQGPHSAEAMERALKIRLGDMALLDHRTIPDNSGNWIVVHRDRTGCDGFDLWIPSAASREAWMLLTESGDLRSAGHQALNWLRTEAGTPWFGADMDSHSLPMEMGLASAISLTKGCYRGQEIVARVTYRGRLDRRLGAVALDWPDPPSRGAKVLAAGSPIGQVTSAVFSPALQRALALAVLKTDFLVPGTRVEVEYETATRSGEVVALPLSRQATNAPGS